MADKSKKVTLRLPPHLVGFLNSVKKTLNCDMSSAVRYSLNIAMYHIDKKISSQTNKQSQVSDEVSDES